MVEIKATTDVLGKIHISDIPESWSYDTTTRTLRMLFAEEGHTYLVEGNAHVIPANIQDEDGWIATIGEKSYLLYKYSESKFVKKYYSKRRKKLVKLLATMC